MKVLVAEDDGVSRLVLQRSLQRLGHDCQLAADGVAAWQLYQESPPDVIISDWLMPGMEGIEFCRRVREAPADAYTYFIFMTALDDKQHFLRGMQAGADDYLTKPVDMDELQARLIAASRVTSLHRRLLEQNGELERLRHAEFEAARTDPLTGVGNRLRLHEDLEGLEGRVRRYRHNYAAALVDVDHFKLYNDRYGHIAGDGALRRVADAIRRGLRTSDALYRYGGEEFLVLLAEQSLEGARVAMERVRIAVEELAIAHEGNPPSGVLTISAGLAALSSADGGDADAWLKRADDALYRAKVAGRNRVAD
jgi:diguanylate cyclase (GGDEF)-like protein